MRGLDINDPDLALARLFARWPDAGAVFAAHGMICLGCPISGFHTVIDACAEYQLDEVAFRDELRRMISR